MRIQICLVVSAVLLAGGVAFADEDINEPVRPIGVNGQEAWNGRATSFLYAPTFGFKAIEGAAKYRFTVNGKIFEAATPTAALSPVWGEIPVGWVTVEARGVAADGRDLGIAGAQRFWKKAAYRPGAYPPAARPYGKAAELVLLNVLNSKSIAILEQTGDIDRAYPHNCYPAKMLARVVTGMVELSKVRPDLRDRALAVAEKGADWMIAHSIAAPSPLAGFPVTYDHHPEAAKVEPTACARISKERVGISMNIYPGYMGLAYVTLYEADGKTKYLDAAKVIADRYLALQGADGTWHLNQRIADGSPVGNNRVMPIQNVLPLFEALARVTGEAKYRAGADRAFAFIENGPLKTWNWEGQFEDTPQAPKYQNLTKHDACSTAIYLLKRFPGDAKRLAQARELLRFAEDQFVFWEKPYTPADEPKEFVEWNRPWAGKWECPGVTEQYSCYRPIDASASKLIQTYLALYRAEGDQLDLAKAKTLGDQATRMQRADGFIPTFWSDHPHVVHDNWVNCMLYTAETLAELARSCEERRLFNGRDLTGWYTYLKGRGRNCDPKGVFTVTNGVIHVTGEEFGALVTEKEYANYRLSLDYRFLGGEQFGGKAGWAPDSGILFHSTGPDGGFHGIWMESVEVNLIKGATGDFWGVGMNGSDRIALSARVGDELLSGKYPIHDPNGTKTYTIKGNTRICRSDIARDWTDTTGVADAVNERPIGEWNHVDLVCRGDEVLVFFNGKLVNRGFGVKPAKGRIQLQSEGCAIEFRDISIESLAKRSGGFIAGPKLARSDQVVGKASREEE